MAILKIRLRKNIIKSMTYFHFLIDSTYAYDFIDFTCRNYPAEKHKFIVLTFPNERECVKNSNFIDRIKILYKNREYLKYLICIKPCDRLIIHGLFNKWVIRFLFINKKLLKKQTTIIMWGADLYKHRELIASRKIVDKIDEFFRSYIFNKVHSLAFDMPTDYQLMKDWYKVTRPALFITYPQQLDRKLIDSVLKEEKNNLPVVNILLGNSASKENYHIEALEILSKFKNDNIMIFCPLSYGNVDNYKEKVIEKGKNLFGDKFTPLTEFMSPDEYARFFAKINIAIFNNNRQQAMGNITLASFLGCKIYLRRDTTMWKQYVEIGKCRFSPIDGIDKLSFEEFIYNEQKSVEMNKDYFVKIHDMDFMKKTWEPIFD